MTTNLTRDLDATPTPERVAQTVREQDPLYPVAFKHAEQTGFNLETDDDGSYNLRRWSGPDKSPLCLTLFAGISLPAVVTICDSVYLDDWNKLHGLLDKLGPLNPSACDPAESSTAPVAPVPNKSNNDPDLVITDLFLTLSYDEDLEEETYSESLEEHESEIIALAIADFNSHFSVPQPPDPDESFIEEQTVNLHYDRHRWSIASYWFEINTTDFPGRVELTFNQPEA